MAEFYSPFVYWGQTKEYISLRVDLRVVTDEVINITEDGFKFEAVAVGVKGKNKYVIDIDLYLPIDTEKSQYKVTEKAVEVQLWKNGVGEIWPRLTEKTIKLHWLKIDFDKFHLEDDSEDERNNETGVIEDFDKNFLYDKDKHPMNFKLTYTFLYNLFQFLGFFYIFIRLQYKFIQNGEDAKTTAFEDVGNQMMLCQMVAILEVIHPMIGLVKTGWVAPFAQVFGRNLILFLLVLQEPLIQIAPVVWYLFVVWSFIELVRYPYYMFSSSNIEINLLTWLRYTLWIPLYPLGFLMEGTVVIMSIPLFEQSNKFSIMYPGSDRYILYFPWFLHGYLVLLALAAYKMMNYMYIQRKKKLGVGFKSKTSEKKKSA
ncbi:hypothetical protein SNE40_011430 [Patella caerulea]|uniref:Very-long-chain (3R)-3-hydroxyacyl-CoA dehydratase n=1 Tax=Patella caerulea TaxID=87958 RepID=A0AAN8PPC2_PATCE